MSVAVAIVDDDAAVRVGLRRLCQALGWSATAFASGREFIASLDGRGPCPDCLLLDAQMPDMTGLEVQAQVRDRGLRLPTFIITAGESEWRGHLAAGAAGVLRKPIGGDELRAAVAAAGLA